LFGGFDGMTLVQGIGMSGYIPLEGVVGLFHFGLDHDSCKCANKFSYLLGTESRVTGDLGILRRVVSFVVFRRFNDVARFMVVRKMGLLSGYYRAGVLFPAELFYVFEDVMGLSYYGGLTYISPRPSFDISFGQLVYTTAWAEYISVDWVGQPCVDSTKFRTFEPCISVQMLGRFEMMLPTFRCDELRKELMR
jgi:hypothetical protein